MRQRQKCDRRTDGRQTHDGVQSVIKTRPHSNSFFRCYIGTRTMTATKDFINTVGYERIVVLTNTHSTSLSTHEATDLSPVHTSNNVESTLSNATS